MRVAPSFSQFTGSAFIVCGVGRYLRGRRPVPSQVDKLNLTNLTPHKQLKEKINLLALVKLIVMIESGEGDLEEALPFRRSVRRDFPLHG